MELTQAPIGVTAIRGMAASGLATTRAILQKTNTGKMLSADAATKDAPLPPYIRIIILLAVVVGGLVLSVSVIMFCSHCLKKIKQLKRKSSVRAEEPERGQYRSLIRQSESNRDEQPASISFAHTDPTNPVVINRPHDDDAKQAMLRETEIEKVEHPATSRLDNDIDYAFAIYKRQIPAFEPEDERTTTGGHLRPCKSPPSSSDVELNPNDVTRKEEEVDEDDDEEEELEEEEEEEGASSTRKQFGFLPIDRLINHRRHVSFELKNANPASYIDCQPQKHHDDNSGDGRLSHQSRSLTGLKQVSFDAGRYSQTTMTTTPASGPSAHRKTDHRPGCLSPVQPIRPRMRERCMTMDPKLQVRDKSFEVRADVHRNQGVTGAAYAKGSSGVGKSGGVSRNLWLSVALENRRLMEEQRPYWNSLELGHDRQMEGNLTRLVNSYDEQIILPSRLITYDPLRITEFLNGPSADDEFGYRAELHKQYLPKRVKVFDAGVSFDQTDLEERNGGRTDGRDMELQAPSDVRRDSTVSSRRDSLAAASYRRDSLTSGADSAPFAHQKTWNRRTFRGIAMSRTIDIPDHRVTRKDDPISGRQLQRQGGPPAPGIGSTGSASTVDCTKDQATSVRRQTYGSAFSNRSRRSTETGGSTGGSAGGGGQGGAGGNSFDSVATDVDASESSHCEVTTTSIESSTTTASTDSTGDAKSSHKLHQMRDDSGYKSLETQQSLAKTGTQSLDVQVMPCRRIAGQSLDSKIYPPPRILVGGRSPEKVKSSLKVVVGGAERQEERCSMLRGTEGRSRERLFPVADEDDDSRSRSNETGNEAGGGASVENYPTQESLRNKKFLEVPSAERGFRLPLTKARSQDFVGSQPDDGAPVSNVPSSASSIFPLSLERLWHRAEHYLSSAVIQAESLLGRSSRDSEPSLSPALEEGQVIPNTDEDTAADKVSGPESTNLGDDSSFPSLCPSPDMEDGKCKDRVPELGAVSSTLLINTPLTYRVSDTVIRPVWSQLIAEKEALAALEQKQTRENGGGSALHTKVDAIRRGDLKTASKKRREYRSRKQLTEICDSSSASLEPASSDRLFGHKDGEPCANYTPDLKRSLTARDYTMDEKTYAIFNEFVQYDPKFDKCSGPCQTGTTSAAELSFDIGSQQGLETTKLSRKQADSVLEAKRLFQGPYPTTRSVSIDVEKTVQTRSPKFDYDSIAEETLPLDSES